MKDGDIYRWRYKDEKPDDLGSYNRYHCKSQIAIARDGILADTFWHGAGQEPFWNYEHAERVLDLTLLGNLNDLEKRPEYEAAYYDDADIVSINHSNSSKGNFYIRKGAVRSREKMRAVLAERVSDHERKIAFAAETLARYRAQCEAIDRGDSIDGMHL